MDIEDRDAIRKPMLEAKEWVLGRADGQFERAFLSQEIQPEVNMIYGTDLYRAGYLYGQLERAMVLTHLTVLFTGSPWLLVRELYRLGGITSTNITKEELARKGVEEMIEEHLELLWPEKSRTS